MFESAFFQRGNYFAEHGRLQKQSVRSATPSFRLRIPIVLTERYTFPSLRDVLYMELGRAILYGSAPRQCCLCGGWFFRKQGDRATADAALRASITQKSKEDLNRL